ncbi:hypothetical protein PG990_002740 [Apiospora arundinis]|uniref:Uncharacterized protein n=1 Tax=Apiospora arundinis TaxID=335852 RepID=A0ABR2IIR2_9PEZI
MSSSSSPIPTPPTSTPSSNSASHSSSPSTQATDAGIIGYAGPESDTRKAFVVECEDNVCPLVVHGVLLPNRTTLKHNTAGDCQCEGSDRALVCTWMYWMAHMCLNHGLITEKEANAILRLTEKDLNLTKLRVNFFGEEGMEKKEELKKKKKKTEETGEEEEEETIEEEVNPALLDAEMFRAVQALTKEEWTTKIINVEEILE